MSGVIILWAIGIKISLIKFPTELILCEEPISISCGRNHTIALVKFLTNYMYGVKIIMDNWD